MVTAQGTGYMGVGTRSNLRKLSKKLLLFLLKKIVQDIKHVFLFIHLYFGTLFILITGYISQ